METNRKHEYRGRTVDDPYFADGVWVYGTLTVDYDWATDTTTYKINISNFLIEQDTDVCETVWAERDKEDLPFDIKEVVVDPATVGERVGFFYGFKVFEGDIIHLKGKEYDKDFGVVRWHENGYFYIDDSFGEFPKDCVKPVGDFFDSISTDFKGTLITVSGNIHDRPELWEGGAK